MTDPLLGTQIGTFQIDAELGRGGMGVVYKATDLALRRPVALKLLSPHLLNDPNARTRFQREIANTVAIEHPHVVPVYSAGFEDGNYFIAMRLVHGPDLWNILQDEGPLPHPRVMRLVGQLASALHSVHTHDLVHRDIKPQNVLVWNAGEPDEHAFLTDFGIAKALDEAQPLTRLGALGTPGYMAPEVRDGEPATPACDQYALGVMAFELLTTKLPFETDDLIQDIPLPLNVYAPETPPELRATIERALSPNPRDRFDDIRAFTLADPTARRSFERSRALSQTVATTRSNEQLVAELHTVHGLTEEAIAEVAGLRKTEVVRLRRKAARKALIGE